MSVPVFDCSISAIPLGTYEKALAERICSENHNRQTIVYLNTTVDIIIELQNNSLIAKYNAKYKIMKTYD